MNMTKQSETSVLVVGAGASGTMLSLQLSRYDTRFRTIDPLPAPSLASRAITVHSRMLEIFELLDQKLAENFLQRGIKNKGYDLHYVNEGKRNVVKMGIDFTTTDCRYPYLLVHRQDETEKVLRDYWHQHFNRSAEWGMQLISVEQDTRGVISVVRNSETGAEEIIRSKYVIACDGINSQVRRCLESGLETRPGGIRPGQTFIARYLRSRAQTHCRAGYMGSLLLT